MSPPDRPVQVGQQRVGHDVAHEIDLVVSVPLGPQVGDRIRGWREEVVADPVDDDAVDLLGHRPVPAAQPGFDVREQGAGLRGDQRAGQGGVHVPDDHHHVRPSCATSGSNAVITRAV